MSSISAFVDLVRDNQKPGMVVLEVGVFKGDTTFEYAPIVKANKGKVICIDWFQGNISSVGETAHRPDEASKRYQAFLNTIEDKGLSDTIEVIKGDSAQLHNRIKTSSVDICLIDGDHRYSKVKEDIKNYLGKVTLGGWLCIHDFEGFEYVNSFTPEQLERDFVNNRQVHGGVVQAVYDTFGKSGEVRNSPGVAPLWVKQVQYKYFDELARSMTWLGEQSNTIFMGQAVGCPGTGMYNTLTGVPESKRIELPVFEETQMGMSIGWAIKGYVPISIFPRWNFLLCATNQLVNHLDCLEEMSAGGYKPRVIIRTGVGSQLPLHPGPQHCGTRFINGFRRMLRNVDVVELDRPEDIFAAYQYAYGRMDGKSTILSEVSDNFHLK